MNLQEQLKQLQKDLKLKQYYVFLYPTAQIYKKQVEELRDRIEQLEGAQDAQDA